MSSQSPPKRKRTTNEDSDSETSEPAITTSKYWFDDGNIIIQVEDTQFRVHRSMLSRHSTVFKDMFDIPQPPQTGERADSDGCPIVHLCDKARDFEYVMSMFYDNIRDHDMRIPMPFDHCAAMLRLGKKYDIEHLFNEGLKRFQHEFPRTLPQWDILCDKKNKTPGREIDCQPDDEFYEQGMALAHELSINSALPAICLSFIQKYTTSEILQKISLLKDNPQVLDYTHLLMRCLEGRDVILCQIHTSYFAWACLDAASPIPDKKCPSKKTCTSHRPLAIMSLAFSSDESFSEINIMGRIRIPRTIDRLLCDKCGQSLRSAIENFRVALWNDLPSIFKFGESWDAVKDC